MIYGADYCRFSLVTRNLPISFTYFIIPGFKLTCLSSFQYNRQNDIEDLVRMDAIKIFG